MSKKVEKENNDLKEKQEGVENFSSVKPHEGEKKEEVSESKSEKDQEVIQLKENITNLKKEIETLKEKYLRSLADLDNLKKEQKKEKERERIIMEERVKYGNEKLIKQFLFFPDNYERAMQSVQKIEHDSKQNPEIIQQKKEKILEGLQMVLVWFQNFLRKQSVEEIKVVPGKDTFDGTLHDPAEVEENSDYPDGTILQVLQKGYKIHDRILRPVTVKISKIKETKK
jgi:molecular chaperone GrpE